MSQSERSNNIRLEEGFTLAPFMGTWYEQKRTNNIKVETEYVQENYHLNPDNTVNVYTTQYDDAKNKLGEITQKLYLDNGPAGYVKFKWFLPKGNYQVVATDYTNYAVVYTETRMALFWSFKGAWIMTRDKNPSAELVKKAQDLLLERVPEMRGQTFHNTRQGDASKYLPPAELERKIRDF